MAEQRPGIAPGTLRHLGPAEDWYCKCRDYGRPVLRSASKWECPKCGTLAPHLEVVNRRV